MGRIYENKRKPKRQGKKITVGKITDVPAGRGATVKLKDGTEVALFNVNVKFHAIENFCPHKAYPLIKTLFDKTDIIRTCQRPLCAKSEVMSDGS